MRPRTPLTPEEREAIAAFPKHKIQYIPRGVSGECITEGWGNRNQRKAAAHHKHIAERVRWHHFDGKTDKQISQALKAEGYQVSGPRVWNIRQKQCIFRE